MWFGFQISWISREIIFGGSWDNWDKLNNGQFIMNYIFDSCIFGKKSSGAFKWCCTSLGYYFSWGQKAEFTGF